MTASRHSITAAAVVTALVTTTAGCGFFGDGGGGASTPTSTVNKSGPTTPVPTTSAKEPGAYSTPDPDDVDFSKPQAVCQAFTNTLFSGNPVREAQTQPIARAAEYVDQGYEKSFLANAPRLAQWNVWDEGGASQLRRIPLPNEVGDERKDRPTRKFRVTTTRVIPSDSERNPVGQTSTFRVYCTLDLVDGNWLVSDHSQHEIDGQ